MFGSRQNVFGMVRKCSDFSTSSPGRFSLALQAREKRPGDEVADFFQKFGWRGYKSHTRHLAKVGGILYNDVGGQRQSEVSVQGTMQ